MEVISNYHTMKIILKSDMWSSGLDAPHVCYALPDVIEIARQLQIHFSWHQFSLWCSSAGGYRKTWQWLFLHNWIVTCFLRSTSANIWFTHFCENYLLTNQMLGGEGCNELNNQGTPILSLLTLNEI